MWDLADIYMWAVNNKWWLICLVPLVIVVLIVRAASPR